MSEKLHPKIAEQAQSLEPGTLVTLYQVDLSSLGINSVYRFTPTRACTFRGQAYTSVDIKAEGFEWNGQGTMPQPTVSLSNVNRVMAGLAEQMDGLVGATFIRLRTYAQYLDGANDEDPEAIYTAEVFTVEQVISLTKVAIEWSLSAAMDQEGRMIPARRVLRDVCTWRYRVFDEETGQFDYTRVQCPYMGGACYDTNGNPTIPADDHCGRRISDCKLRFGQNAELPYGGFPGVARIRP